MDDLVFSNRVYSIIKYVFIYNSTLLYTIWMIEAVALLTDRVCSKDVTLVYREHPCSAARS